MTQREFFLEIWMERPHVSEVSGNPLGHEPLTFHFSHVLSKGAEPAAKFDKENIMLMTLEEHQTWENFKATIRNNPRWDHVLQRAVEMKRKYNNKDPYKV
jgi:hypothetical protein